MHKRNKTEAEMKSTHQVELILTRRQEYKIGGKKHPVSSGGTGNVEQLHVHQ